VSSIDFSSSMRPQTAAGNLIAAIAWLASKPGRKAISLSGDAAVLRQFYRYLRRSGNRETVVEPNFAAPAHRIFFRSLFTF